MTLAYDTVTVIGTLTKLNIIMMSIAGRAECKNVITENRIAAE